MWLLLFGTLFVLFAARQLLMRHKQLEAAARKLNALLRKRYQLQEPDHIAL
jgi:HAMP domain-containing protein